MNGLYQSDLKFLLKYAKAVLVLLGKKNNSELMYILKNRHLACNNYLLEIKPIQGIGLLVITKIGLMFSSA